MFACICKYVKKTTFFVAVKAIRIKKVCCRNVAITRLTKELNAVFALAESLPTSATRNGRFQLNRVEIQITKPTIQKYVILSFLKTKSKFQTLFRFFYSIFLGVSSIIKLDDCIF